MSCPLRSFGFFDEIHKYRQWRNYLKGLYDVRPENQRIMVTGSARLDFYRFGGDSLQGRYHLLRLHPFSIRAAVRDIPDFSFRSASNSSGQERTKHYHFDWSVVPEPAPRFENLVAAHLLKWVHYEQDAKGRDLELRYFRDVDRREVDFVVVEGRRPILFVETKWSDAAVDSSLHYLLARFPKTETWQVSVVGKKDYVTPDGIRVAPALHLLKAGLGTIRLPKPDLRTQA